MTAPQPVRVGWCPGALKPMASGDGLIVRIKPRGAALSIDQACGIARVAAAYGNGALDLTTRANLQIRGVTPGGLAPLTAALAALDLLDPNAAAESARNVIVSPLAGCDPGAAFDIRPMVAALERRLVEHLSLHALPAKFGFLVDDGGSLSLRAIAADIGFEAVTRDGAPAFALRLGAEEAATGAVAATIAADDMVHAATALALAFLAARKADPDLRRMRDLIGGPGAAAILAKAGLAFRPVTLPPRVFSFGRLIGPQKCGATHAFGAAAPFGRLKSEQLAALASAATGHGAATLRLTPWRAILLAGLDASDLAVMTARLKRAGFIMDPADIRLRIAACPGAPDCHRATTTVLDDAALLAARLRPAPSQDGIVLHVSGCAKGCAHAGRTALGLVAQDGAYRPIKDGRARDAGVGPGLSMTQAAQWVEAAGMVGS